MTRLAAVAGLLILVCCKSLDAFVIDEHFSGTGPFSFADGTQTINADYNGNGRTGGRDMLAWQNNLGMTGADLIGDGDDGSGTGTPDEVVDQADLSFWQNHYGETNLVTGFDADGWVRGGIPANATGTFDLEKGHFVHAADQSPVFILNFEGSFDIYQMQAGMIQNEAPVGETVHYEVEFEDFTLATPATDPNAMTGVTQYSQHMIAQMNFGDVDRDASNPGVEILHFDVQYDVVNDKYLFIAALQSNVVNLVNVVFDPRETGVIGPDEEITALDWRVTVAPDGAGSNITVEYDINNTGTFTDALEEFLGRPGGTTGEEFPVDLTQSENVILNQVALTNLFVDPFEPGAPFNPFKDDPHPFLLGNGVSLDRLFYSTPDPPAGVNAVPEPGNLILLLVAGWSLAAIRVRD